MCNGLSCSLEFSGYSDYWGGMGGRGRGKGCAFAFYGRDTTLRDIVDQWVDDTLFNEYDFEDIPESVTQSDIRDCIVASLTESGRADYDSGALCEWSAYYEDNRECRECGASIGEPHESDCHYVTEYGDYDVEDDDCDDNDYDESPIVILCIDWSDHPDYKLESEWGLSHYDAGYFGWVHNDGREYGHFGTEQEAWDDCPNCPIIHRLKEGRG